MGTQKCWNLSATYTHDSFFIKSCCHHFSKEHTLFFYKNQETKSAPHTHPHVTHQNMTNCKHKQELTFMSSHRIIPPKVKILKIDRILKNIYHLILKTTISGPSSPPSFVSVSSSAPTTMVVDWSFLPRHTWGGQLLGYKISYKKFTEKKFQFKKIHPGYQTR